MKRIGVWLQQHYISSMILSAIVGTLITWVLGWILPNTPVDVANIPQKSLVCTLNYSQRIIEKHTNDERFKITFDGEEIVEPYIFSISIENNGDYSIDNSDFKKEFIIDFQGCDKIINATIESSTNQYVWDEIKDNARFEGTKLIITDFFLNPQEKFSLSVITEKKPQKIMYSPRIDGIPQLTLINTTQAQRETMESTFIIMVSFVLFISLCIVVYLIILNKKYKKWKKEYIHHLYKQT